MKRFLFLALSFLLLHTGAFSQKISKVLKDPDLKIEQKKFYHSPGYEDGSRRKPENFGPLLDESYIDDEEVETIGDLSEQYDLSKMYLQDGWSDKYDIRKGKFVMVKYKGGTMLPAIQTPDGSLFCFLIEEGHLACDIKASRMENGQQKVIFLTAEMFKDE